MYAFERLEVWKLGREFVCDIYAITDAFPKREHFALCQQLTRAAVSITANIAEGSAKASNKEFSRYVEISFGSLCEVIAELYVALDRQYIAKDQFNALYAKSERIGMMLSKLRSSLENSWRKTSNSQPTE